MEPMTFASPSEVCFDLARAIPFVGLQNPSGWVPVTRAGEAEAPWCVAKTERSDGMDLATFLYELRDWLTENPGDGFGIVEESDDELFILAFERVDYSATRKERDHGTPASE